MLDKTSCELCGQPVDNPAALYGPFPGVCWACYWLPEAEDELNKLLAEVLADDAFLLESTP